MTVIEIHPIGPTERSSRSVARKDGGRVELVITPIADCETCAKTIPALACSCCGDAFLARLAIAHAHGLLLCMECLAVRSTGKTCDHVPAAGDALMRLVELLETGATN